MIKQMIKINHIILYFRNEKLTKPIMLPHIIEIKMITIISANLWNGKASVNKAFLTYTQGGMAIKIE